MRKILFSLFTVGVVAIVAFATTQAFFSDTETSVGNVLSAGAIDLKIDSTAHYAGMICSVGGVWVDDEDLTSNNSRPELLGHSCVGSWELKNLVAGDTFFNLTDLKPGDSGENTISMHVINNDAYMCAIVDNMQNNDDGFTEPEQEDGDVTDGDGQGELANEVHFFAWADDGDNVWESGEQALFSNTEGSANDVIDGVVYSLYTPATGGSIAGATTKYMGLYWCYGTLTVAPNTLTCSGSSTTNLTQTDSLSADISFYVEQARNNDQFECPTIQEWRENNGGEQRPLVGAALDKYQAPVCNLTVDDSFTSPSDPQFNTIQAAIDAAENNEVICVDEGDYSEFVVNKPVTIAGLVNPETSAEVKPSSATVNDLALVESSDVTITGLHFNGSGMAFTGNQLAGIRISPSVSSIDNVNITYNLIENLAVSGANPASKGIQWHNNNLGFSLTNSSFKNNVIRSISSTNKGGYGIQTVGDTDGLDIEFNTISNIAGAWGAGIAIDALSSVSNTATNIKYNHIMSGIWAATFPVSVQVEHNVDQTGIFVNYNNIEGLVHGGGATEATGDSVDAKNNWWGDTDPSNDIYGPVDYSLSESSAFNLN